MAEPDPPQSGRYQVFNSEQEVFMSDTATAEIARAGLPVRGMGPDVTPLC